MIHLLQSAFDLLYYLYLFIHSKGCSPIHQPTHLHYISAAIFTTCIGLHTFQQNIKLESSSFNRRTTWHSQTLGSVKFLRRPVQSLPVFARPHSLPSLILDFLGCAAQPCANRGSLCKSEQKGILPHSTCLTLTFAEQFDS